MNLNVARESLHSRELGVLSDERLGADGGELDAHGGACGAGRDALDAADAEDRMTHETADGELDGQAGINGRVARRKST